MISIIILIQAINFVKNFLKKEAARLYAHSFFGANVYIYEPVAGHVYHVRVAVSEGGVLFYWGAA
jgi:hypothetical protein